MTIEQNELQKIQAKTQKAFNAVYLEILEDLKKKSPVDYQGVKKVFDDNDYIKRSEQIVLNGNYEGAFIGLGNGYAIISLDDFNDYFLHTKYDGLSLSQRLHTSQVDAIKNTTKVIQTQLKFRTNWKKLSKEIGKTSNTVGDISSLIGDLNTTGNKYLKGQLSKAELKVFNKQIQKAQGYVDGLATNGAPTGQLKKAYQGIIDSALSKDKALLDKTIKKAIDSKVGYNNDRISRTELSRASSQSFQRKIVDDDDVDGWIWRLSPQHPRVDECDYYADVDNGEGPGVYKIDDSALIPAHPFCLCMQQPYVIKGDRKSNLKDMTKSNAIKYLDSLPEKERGQIIGVENAKSKSRYIKGLEKKGVVFNGPKPKALPKRLVKQI